MKIQNILSKALDNNFSLVGTQFQCEWLPVALRFSNEVSISDNNLDLVSFPSSNQVQSVSNFINMLEEKELGSEVNRDIISDFGVNMSNIKDLLLHPESSKINYISFTINLDKIIVNHYSKDINICGIKYKEITIHLESDAFSGNLYVLLREDTSNGLSVFTDLLNKKISKPDTKKLLDFINHRNIMGLGLVAVTLDSKNAESSLFPISSDLSSISDKEKISFRTDTGIVNIPWKFIDNSLIIKEGLNSYTFNIKSGKSINKLSFQK